MKLFENIKKLGQIFKIIDWVNNNKNTFYDIHNKVAILRGDVTQLKVDVCDLKTIATGNKESNN